MKYQQQLEEVEQLRREAAIQRIAVSRAVEDLKVGGLCKLSELLPKKG